MAMPHHGSEEQRIRNRLLDQFLGTAERRWPQGRVEGADDGELVFAVAVDREHQIIRVEFGKQVSWLGLDREAAEKLRDALSEKLLELRGITA